MSVFGVVVGVVVGHAARHRPVATRCPRQRHRRDHDPVSGPSSWSCRRVSPGCSPRCTRRTRRRGWTCSRRSRPSDARRHGDWPATRAPRSRRSSGSRRARCSRPCDRADRFRRHARASSRPRPSGRVRSVAGARRRRRLLHRARRARDGVAAADRRGGAERHGVGRLAEEGTSKCADRHHRGRPARTCCCPSGWVDNKVCAIDDTWSGLRFALRRELR